MKTICWVTPDCFLDTDLDYNLISGVLKEFNIYWIVVFDEGHRFKESDFDILRSENKNLNVEFVYFKHRARHPHTIVDYLKIRAIIKRVNPDIIYFNIIPNNPYILPLYMWLPKNKTIVTAHDGRVTNSMKLNALVNIGFTIGFNAAKHVNMFSKYQASFFEQKHPGKDVTVIPLSLKDFGKPSVSKRYDYVSFVYFGTIHEEKNLELLIEAANSLADDGISNFRVSINGGWRVPWKPEEKIRHIELFELNIGSIPNEDIPNIFAYNHFAVYPYKNMSQSGAIKCAFNYHTPVIVSNLPGFTDEVVENVDGFIFESENVQDLKRVMKSCIVMSKSEYDNLVSKMKQHVERAYAKPKIIDMYINMFNKLLEDEHFIR